MTAAQRGAEPANDPAEFTHRLFSLTGRTALVTGGSRGLGLQMARALGMAGARLVLTSRSESDLEDAIVGLRSAGVEADAVAGDASAPNEILRICDSAVATLGHIDILVNNAGATWGAPAEDYPLEAWDKVMNLNVRSVFLFCQHVARECMIPRHFGRIVNVASVKGLLGNAGQDDTLAYNTSKAAVINLTRTLAGEWGEHGITVNAIAPGWFPSKMTLGTIARQGETAMASRTPLRRLGGDQDLMGGVLLLASNAGSYITGQLLAIDGGMSAVGAD